MHFNSKPIHQIADTQPIIRNLTSQSNTATVIVRNNQTSDVSESYHDFVQDHCQTKDGQPTAFHEVIVIFPDDIQAYDLTRPKQIIKDYIRIRGATESLSIAAIKLQSVRIQLEFLISTKDLKHNTLLTKPSLLFKSIAAYLEATYPELTNTRPLKPQQKFPRKFSSPDQKRHFQIIRHRQTQTRAVATLVQKLFDDSQTIAELIAKIETTPDLELYSHQDEPIGFRYRGQKYRFITVGICTGKVEQLKVYTQRIQTGIPRTSVTLESQKLRCEPTPRTTKTQPSPTR